MGLVYDPTAAGEAGHLANGFRLAHADDAALACEGCLDQSTRPSEPAVLEAALKALSRA